MSGEILFVKAHARARIPRRAYVNSIGLDIASCEEVIIKARDSGCVDTGLKAKPPTGTFLQLASRSGLAAHHKIVVGAGILDPNYTGTIRILLFNHSDQDFKVEVGKNIAQMLCLKVAMPQAMKVKELEETMRGNKGFGSSGY